MKYEWSFKWFKGRDGMRDNVEWLSALLNASLTVESVKMEINNKNFNGLVNYINTSKT